MDEIVNRVAQSGLKTINLEEFRVPGERVEFDIADQLWEGLVLKEKDFRQFVNDHDFLQYKDKHIALTCSADAIVPFWAYMLLASKLKPHASKIVFGNLETLELVLFQEELSKKDFSEYKNERVIIKGCSKEAVPIDAYLQLLQILQPHAKSIMYGEPCSTVPIYKKPKA